MAKRGSKKKGGAAGAPSIENRRARYDYFIEDTLECGIVLQGSEVKAIRDGNASLAEGFVTVTAEPPGLALHQVQISLYPPAGANQHQPQRVRRLLANRREIARLARQVEQKGVTLVPLRMYFKGGLIKVEVGLARGKAEYDKRRKISDRQAA
ncbi:MAG: SsrA-binding protein SmpB [Phycisphaerales bacterium JB040]